MRSKKPDKAVNISQGRKGSVHVSDKVTLDPNNPIPFDGRGSAFAASDGTEYLPFLNPLNTFAQVLLEAKSCSVTQQACVNSKKLFIAGRGLGDKDGKELTKEKNPVVRGFLDRMNKRGEGESQIMRKAAGSFLTFGNTPIEILRYKLGDEKKLGVFVHNFLEWRKCVPDENGDIVEAIHSRLFNRDNSGSIIQLNEKTSRKVPLYDIEKPSNKRWLKDANGVERSMIWLQNDMDGYDNYGMPSSYAGLINQVLEYKGARYNLDDFENNMVIGALLALKGNVTDREAKKIAAEIINMHSGDGKRGRVAVIASEEGGIEESSLHNFNTKKDGSYIELDKSNTEKIFLASEWSALLAGLSQANSMGKGNSFLRTEFNLRKTTVIDPIQEYFVNNLWKVIFEIAQEWIGGDWAYNLQINDIDPVSALSEIDPTAAIQVNEMRESVGLKADPKKEGVYMSEMKSSPAPAPGDEKEPTPPKNK